MDTRRTIDLATGLLMGRLGCGPEDAFDLLRRESQNHNQKLSDVATGLLARPAVPRLTGLRRRRCAGTSRARSPRPRSARRGETPAHGR